MSFYQGQRMGGTRGGKDYFNWDDVRGDKYKENYLGQSLKLTSNWWHEGKLKVADVNNKEKRGAAASQQHLEELRRIKQQDEELMKEALGLKPKQRRLSSRALEKHEFKDLLKRGTTERDEQDVSRVGGLGYEPAPIVSSQGISMSAGISVPGKEDTEEAFRPEEKHQKGSGSAESAVQSQTPTDNEKLRKREKKEKKEKKSKKDKKDKKEKKEKKRRYRSNDESEVPRRRRHDSPEPDDRNRRRHDSPEKKRSPSPRSRDGDRSKRRRHDSRSPEPRKRHDSRSPVRRRRHDSPQ
eukprot:TRINITY_DN4653_c0_g1_i1.p1 TRINITY_DN4653_c0_g1~~TRINITY_DN4653_c0_g1_i1.p1  ORF type:complete len:296 (-),score=45.23 TRINITY_DN4653_c0_g1_i1:16-903(-)